MKIIIYQSRLCEMGGVETFLFNWCYIMRNYFDIVLLYCTTDKQRLRKMQRLVKCEKYEDGKEYEADIVIRNSVWGKVPYKLKSKLNRYIELRHANYKFLKDKGKLEQQYTKWDKVNEIVSCGEFVAEMSRLVMKDNPTVIKNILLPKRKTQKVLRLISCTRIDPEKGWNRILTMCDMLRIAGIKFTWDIFTNSYDYKSNYEELRMWKARDDIFDYVANADYTVLLSDSEGLPYTIQESLQYQTPCIVTDVGGCTELIKDGVNGYVVPLDMNFDITRILDIPICGEYDNNAEELWLKYLGYKGPKKEIEIVEERKMKVRALKDFGKIIDTDINRVRAEGEEWIIDEIRYETIKKYEEAKELKLIEVVEEEKTKKTKKKAE